MTEDTPVNEIDPISTALREIARADAATHGRSVEELMRGAVNLGADGIHLSARDIAGILAVMDEAGASAISMADRAVELRTRVAELEAQSSGLEKTLREWVDAYKDAEEAMIAPHIWARVLRSRAALATAEALLAASCGVEP